MVETSEPEPAVFALLLFGFSLGVLAVELLVSHAAAGALVFAIFVAGIAEVVGGWWEIRRGENYLGSVMATFGLWLVGLFLMETVGHVLDLVNSTALAAYFLVLLVPIALMYVPAYANRMPWPIHTAFAGLFFLVLFAGAQYATSVSVLGPAAGVMAAVAAVSVWTLALKDVRTL